MNKRFYVTFVGALALVAPLPVLYSRLPSKTVEVAHPLFDKQEKMLEAYNSLFKGKPAPVVGMQVSDSPSLCAMYGKLSVFVNYDSELNIIHVRVKADDERGSLDLYNFGPEKLDGVLDDIIEKESALSVEKAKEAIFAQLSCFKRQYNMNEETIISSERNKPAVGKFLFEYVIRSDVITESSFYYSQNSIRIRGSASLIDGWWEVDLDKIFFEEGVSHTEDKTLSKEASLELWQDLMLENK